jgi:hypothetical protein
MGLTELWQKLKTLSLVASQEDAYTPTSTGLPQVYDAKALGWHTSQAEPGKACNTCSYYHLQVELLPDTPTPPKPQHDYDEEELINLVKLPNYVGYCTKLQAKWGCILSGIRSDHGCIYWEEKPAMEQFDDNVIEEDDGRTPVAPTIIGGV